MPKTKTSQEVSQQQKDEKQIVIDEQQLEIIKLIEEKNNLKKQLENILSNFEQMGNDFKKLQELVESYQKKPIVDWTPFFWFIGRLFNPAGQKSIVRHRAVQHLINDMFSVEMIPAMQLGRECSRHAWKVHLGKKINADKTDEILKIIKKYQEK